MFRITCNRAQSKSLAAKVAISYSRPAQPVAREPHVISGNILNEKRYFNLFPAKAEIECRSSFEKTELFSCGDIRVHYVGD